MPWVYSSRTYALLSFAFILDAKDCPPLKIQLSWESPGPNSLKPCWRTSQRKGQKVTADTIIGKYGDTGGRDYTAHLHIQFDADAKNPRWMYGIASTGNIMYKGTIDSTITPAKAWYLRDGQTITPTNGETYYFPAEVNIPLLPKAIDYKALYEEAQVKLDKIKAIV